MTQVTSKADLRGLFGPVRDQGARPTCLAFAISDLHAAARGDWQPLSPEYLFYQAQKNTKRGPHQGAFLSAILDAVAQDGQPIEAGWPYLTDTPADVTKWEPPKAPMQIYRRRGAEDADQIDAIVAHIDHGRPIAILLRLSHSFDWVGPDGVIDPSKDEKPDPSRRHAVLAAGHGEVAGSRAILIRNSWGPDWGDNGYAWLTERFLRTRLFATALMKEDLSVPSHPVAA